MLAVHGHSDDARIEAICDDHPRPDLAIRHRPMPDSLRNLTIRQLKQQFLAESFRRQDGPDRVYVCSLLLLIGIEVFQFSLEGAAGLNEFLGLSIRLRMHSLGLLILESMDEKAIFCENELEFLKVTRGVCFVFGPDKQRLITI